MSKDKKGWSGKAVTCVRHDEYLSEAFELTVENGLVVKIEAITRAPDLLARAVGTASRSLWAIARDSK
jgi:hypothetical protein